MNQSLLEQQLYLKTVYSEVNGNVFHFALETPQRPQQIHKPIVAEDIALHSFTENHQFLTLNTFYNSRQIESLRQLNALFIDLDPYHNGLKLDTVLTDIKKNEFGKTVPFPSYVIRSGQGAYLIWLIDPLPASERSQWENAQEALYSIFENYGADHKSLDCSRVLRVPGSINGKEGVNKAVVIEFENGIRYSFEDISTIWLKEKIALVPKTSTTSRSRRGSSSTEKKKTTSTQSNPKKTYPNMTRKKNANPVKRRANMELALQRARDVETILLMHGENVEGHREFGLFLYRLFLMQAGKSFNYALKQATALNARLFEPLPYKEMKEATNPTSGDYRYGNKRLIAELGVTDEMFPFLKTILPAEEKQKHEWAKVGRTMSRKDETATRKARIEELRSQGKTIREIMDEMGISKTTYYNLKNGRKRKKHDKKH